MKKDRLDALSKGLPATERRKMSGDIENVSKDLLKNKDGLPKKVAHRKTEKRHEDQLRLDYARLSFSLRFFLRIKSIFQGIDIWKAFTNFKLKELLKELSLAEYPLLRKSAQEIYLTPCLAIYLHRLFLLLRKCDLDFKRLEEKSEELAYGFLDSEHCEKLNISVQRFCQEEKLKKCLQRGENREKIFGSLKIELKRYCRIVGENLGVDFTIHQAILYQISDLKKFDIDKILSLIPQNSHSLDEHNVVFEEVKLSAELKKNLNLFFETVHKIGYLEKVQVNLEPFCKEEEQCRAMQQLLENIRHTWNSMLENLRWHDLQLFLTARYYLEVPQLHFNLENYSKSASETLEKACYTKIESEFIELYSKGVKEFRKELQKLYFGEKKFHLQFYSNSFRYEDKDNFQLLRTASHLRPKKTLLEFFFTHKITTLTLYIVHWLVPRLKGFERALHALFEKQTAIRQQSLKLFSRLRQFDNVVKSFDETLSIKSPKGLELREQRLKAIEGELIDLKNLESYIEKIDNEAAQLYEEGKGDLEKLTVVFQRIQQMYGNEQFHDSHPKKQFQEKIVLLEQSLKDLFFLLKISDE